MPAQYGIHTSTTKSILLIEYSIGQLTGRCVIMTDYSSVSLMQHQLNWQHLQQRRKVARLLLLYKALYNHIALQVPPYYTLSHCNTRANHQFSFVHPSARTNVYKYMYSFYPKTIKHWNNLSSDMASAQSPAEFLKLITIATSKLTCTD